ncbi:hypothetical protein B0H16DRAFT_223892 [Mycena metata]|uniref:Uncharacterized protein n=1 Tax=Mycena metata TaxID=1033252 RepID=A0AAD7HY62_9AGAR|nr:hypothetical protein B0H16DRAFT_223892 [Mycena metata]
MSGSVQAGGRGGNYCSVLPAPLVYRISHFAFRAAGVISVNIGGGTDGTRAPRSQSRRKGRDGCGGEAEGNGITIAGRASVSVSYLARTGSGCDISSVGGRSRSGSVFVCARCVAEWRCGYGCVCVCVCGRPTVSALGRPRPFVEGAGARARVHFGSRAESVGDERWGRYRQQRSVGARSCASSLRMVRMVRAGGMGVVIDGAPSEMPALRFALLWETGLAVGGRWSSAEGEDGNRGRRFVGDAAREHLWWARADADGVGIQGYRCGYSVRVFYSPAAQPQPTPAD